MSDQQEDARPSGVAAWDRGAVWRRLGAPSDQVGSVNDPRVTDELGVRWNEKWVYRDPRNGRALRVVLWNRYDLMGAFRATPQGGFEPEPLGLPGELDAP